MPITIYNTLTKEKEEFVPLNKNEVTFYVCGVTVYDYCHIGHARVYVAFDAIRKVIEEEYPVKFIQNFTDIDDKIIARANEKNIPFSELTETYIKAFFEDIKTLGIKPATHYPKATESLGDMFKMIKTLIEKKAAYEKEGHVYFKVSAHKDYGKLSKKVLEELEAGNRVDVSHLKEDPMDFVLWKPSKEGEPSWQSPWGNGRPGWHIECSAMAIRHLGETIDIHGGGEDLIFPHHENEIAQSECCTGKPFSRYWMHNGFVNIDNKKMSKSKNNFITLREFLKKYSGEILRFFLLKVHYRHPLNFTEEGLIESKQALDRLYHTLKNIKEVEPTTQQKEVLETFETRFKEATRDDFNFPKAIGVLFELNKLVNTENIGKSLLLKLGNSLGILIDESRLNEQKVSEEIQELIDKRNEAKTNKNWADADKYRDLLSTHHGIVLEDTKDGIRIKYI